MSAPVFDAGVLSALTQKIQHDLKKGPTPKKPGRGKGGDLKAVRQSQGPARPQQSSPAQGRKRKRDAREKPFNNDRGSRPPYQRKTGPNATPVQHQARAKNDRAGKHDARKPSSGIEKQRSSKFDLRQIVNDLGGDEEDLKLIEEAGSESELEGEAVDDKGLKKDLQQMVQELGLTGTNHDDAATSEEEYEEEDGDEDTTANGLSRVSYAEDESDQDSSEDEGESAETPETRETSKVAVSTLTARDGPNAAGLWIEPQPEWHTIGLAPITRSGKGFTSISPGACNSLLEYAKQLLQEENDQYAKSTKSSTSANQFYSTIMASGTLSDKISALTLSVQESPLHNMRTLENLLNMAKKRNRGQAVDTLGALKDLLGPGSLLPSDRRLRNFNAQPGLKFVDGKDLDKVHPSKGLPKSVTKAHLMLWAFEDWLKSTYFEMLKVLEVWCNDEIPYTRLKSVGYIYELLRDKPEQEANLLRLLVNKLGDTDKKIASKASYYILQIENSHPGMKALITSAIEADFLFRPHQSNHAKYYGIITLNQTVLSAREEGLSRQLLDIYFALFLALLKPPTEDPKAPKPVAKVNSKGEAQGGGSAPGKKAQKKAAAEARSTAAEEELREKMVSAVLTGVNRAIPFVDKTADFLDKHVDTLFRVTHSANFNTSVQALMLIQQLCGSHQAASDRFYRTLYESLLDPRILTSSKQALYLNLLYRALRSDLSVKRIKAFVKRLLQMTAMHQPAFACAVVYLIRELEAIFPSLAAFVDQPEADESDEEEAFKDADKENDDLSASKPTQSDANGQLKPSGYDGRKRDPEYAAAERSCLWELSPLKTHFHPSVALFATSLLQHDPMPSKPDLNSNTLIQFLDRFVYRNPKKDTSGFKGHSIMQPLAAAGDGRDSLVAAVNMINKAKGPLNTEGFRAKSSKDVAPDEVFFHRYFNEVGKKSDKAKKKKEDKKAEDEEEDEDIVDEGEDEIWQALVESRPEIEGEDGDEDGFDEEDFGDEMDSVEGEENVDADDADQELLEAMDGQDDDSEEPFDFDEDDALLDSDDELPDGLGVPVADAPTEKEAEGTSKKGSNKRRKMLKSLPMFASADDYAKMLDDDDD